MNYTLILERASQLKSWASEHRRYLHQHPELSLQEKQTAHYCAHQLAELGYEIKPSWGYGFTADLMANINYPSTKTIAIRADMDALPIQEKNVHDFVSLTPMIAHMCGHDSHMAIALTAAKILAEYQSNQHLTANVRFLFQPSEEKIPGGAMGMIAAGCLEGVDEVYGLHNNPEIEVGKICTRVGALTAAADLFSLEIIGKGCHAAKPQNALDPVYMGAQLITQWHTIISRRINPFHPAVLSVTQFASGDTFNVIPDNATLKGTIRTFNEQDRQLIVQLMQQSLLVPTQQGFQCHFNYQKGYDSVINASMGVNRVAALGIALLGKENVNTHADPESFAEDFAYFLQKKPGAFYFLGSGNAQKGISESIHSARFEIDEQALVIGAAMMAALVLSS